MYTTKFFSCELKRTYHPSRSNFSVNWSDPEVDYQPWKNGERRRRREVRRRLYTCVCVSSDATAQVPLRLQQRSPARSHQRHVSAALLSQSERSREEPSAGWRQGPEVAARRRGKVVGDGGRGQGRKEFATVGWSSGPPSYRFLNVGTLDASYTRSRDWLAVRLVSLWQTSKRQ